MPTFRARPLKNKDLRAFLSRNCGSWARAPLHGCDVSLALAFAREARLRRALQRLLAKILSQWRTAHESRPSSDSSRADQEPVRAAEPGRGVDRRIGKGVRWRERQRRLGRVVAHVRHVPVVVQRPRVRRVRGLYRQRRIAASS